MISALIVHSYNLKNGLKVTGYDEDDPVTEDLLLPQNFVENSLEMMTFRYKSDHVEGDIIMKFIPQNMGAESYIDINAMLSTSDDQIYSCELKIGQFDFKGEDKKLLDNIDEWGVEGSG